METRLLDALQTTSRPDRKMHPKHGSAAGWLDDSYASSMTVQVKLAYSRLYNMSPNPSTRENVFRNDILYMGDHPCGAGLATSHISYCYSFLSFKDKLDSMTKARSFMGSPSGHFDHPKIFTLAKAKCYKACHP